jgi:hypothetical protein
MNAGIDEATYERERGRRFERFHAELITGLEREPWVADVTLATSLPDQAPSRRIAIDGLPAPQGAAGHLAQVNYVAPDFFDAFGAQVLSGRGFHSGDRDSAGLPKTTASADVPRAGAEAAIRTVIVNRTFVERILGGGNALGRRVRYVAPGDASPGDAGIERWHEVVGVVTDLHKNVLDAELVSPQMYHPLSVANADVVTFAIRVRGESPSSVAGRLRDLTLALDPTMRLSVRPLLEIYRQQDVAVRLVALVVGLITASVLLLSAAGIYSLMSFTVAQRRKEIGIRAALGAEPHRLVRSIFARAAVQLASGVGVGVAAVIVLDTQSNGDLLGGHGAILVPVVSVMMLGAGLIATIGPARRGLRLEPTQALRE